MALRKNFSGCVTNLIKDVSLKSGDFLKTHPQKTGIKLFYFKNVSPEINMLIFIPT